MSDQQEEAKPRIVTSVTFVVFEDGNVGWKPEGRCAPADMLAIERYAAMKVQKGMDVAEMQAAMRGRRVVPATAIPEIPRNGRG